MKKVTTIVLVITASLVCLVASLFITWCAWEMQIEGRAFRCSDDGLSIAFWESANAHEAAGDRILPGWTWEDVRTANGIYEFCFFALWLGGSTVAVRIINSVMKDCMIEASDKSPQPTPAAPVS